MLSHVLLLLCKFMYIIKFPYMQRFFLILIDIVLFAADITQSQLLMTMKKTAF